MSLLTNFHFIMAVVYGYSSYFYVYGVVQPAEITAAQKSTYGAIKYLTYWDLLVQCAFFTLCFLSNVFSSAQQNKRKTAPEKILDFLFSSIVFPLALFTDTTFWGLYFTDRELVFPKVYDDFYPSWLNHVVHSLPLAAALLEMLCVQRSFPSYKKGFLCNSLFLAIYLSWVLFIAHTTGDWVYPVLAKLPTPQRSLFIFGLFVLMWLCYSVCRILYSFKWRQPARSEKKVHQKKNK
ncbi:androgen-induced gene 1 protein [Hyalella azteca]|uniref:Androgen-induced gene 1 protein n=1 Tax=Hyalella azteca TaxID=294128 RepID=A0A8B7P0X7_HYAAZ|nr:androgen-induced gene 1 protein [Hyalella azteca]